MARHTAKEKNDMLTISGVDWDSPAWVAEIRPGQIIKSMNGKPASQLLLREITSG